jgi:murein hydrolase activator
MRRRKRRRIGWLFWGWLVLFGSIDLWTAWSDAVEKDLSQGKKDLKEIKKEISVTKEKEKQIRGKETSVLESLYQIETDLYRKERELKQMEAQLNQVRDKRQKTRDQIVLLNKGLEQTKEDLFSRLTALYKMEKTPPEIFLFASQSYPDLLKVDKYLKVIVDYDTQLVKTFRYQVSLKEKYERELIEDQAQWQRSISEVEKKKEEIKKVGEAKRNLLRSIQNQKIVYQKVIRELEQRAKDLQAFVDKLEREKKAFAYGKPRQEPFRGKLVPPVQGNVISQFKERGQNGIEIKAPMGAEIRAVLPGKVLYADWFKGFGNVVIIDHGDHTFTISGYCSQLLKKAGDTVRQGEAIAQVGSAGSLKGPCLYFEIRHRGKPQNPTEWISHPDKVVSLPESNGKERKGL